MRHSTSEAYRRGVASAPQLGDHLSMIDSKDVAGVRLGGRRGLGLTFAAALLLLFGLRRRAMR